MIAKIPAFFDGVDGTVLRLWEQAGKIGACTVNLLHTNNFKRAYPCNLRNEITDNNGIEIVDNSFQFVINANQPVSFILQ